MLLGIFLFSSCGSLPSKPKIELCGHNAPAALAECFDNQDDSFRSIPMSDTDKYIMFSPDDWGLVLRYISQLQRHLSKSGNKSNMGVESIAARELKKILKTSKKLTLETVQE
jgi:hypothetical protein